MSRDHPPLLLDGNIFGLQTFGGVSGYAGRLFAGFRAAGRTPRLVLPPRLLYQGNERAELDAQKDSLRERLPARIGQYLPAKVGHGRPAFLSPYYRRPGGPVRRHVVTVHDFTYERFRSGLALRVHHATKMAAIRAADAIICISEATLQDVREYCPDIDPRRLHVVHHGVDTTMFFPDRSGAPAGMDDTILFVGQRGGYKRFDLAVEAVSLLPELRLGIVGPPLTAEESARLQKLLPGRSVWFGRVSHDELRRLYSAAHAFLFPSDYEGFGLPVLEAMACGCPVITSADRALREVGGDEALFATSQQGERYAAAIAELASGPSRASRINKGLDRARSASWDSCIDKTLAILDGEA